MSLGVTVGTGKVIAWLCGDPECTPLGKATYNMSARQLDVYEHRAVCVAAAESADPLLQAILGRLYDAGVRNLDELDSDRFKIIATELGKVGEFQDALTNFLNGFGKAARHTIANEVPF